MWRRSMVLAIGTILVGVSLTVAAQQAIPDISLLQPAAQSARFDYPPGNLPQRTVAVEDLPQVLIDAVVAIEDRRFFDHDGVDLWGTGRALWSNWQAGTVVAGGSTLTQQLVKNLFLSPEQSWERKSREMLIAIAIEDSLSKAEILAYYLNRVYFGSGAYGVADAAALYFDQSVADLTLPEAALLAGVVQAPSVLSPLVNPDRSRARRNLVLRVMAEAGFIDADTAAAAQASPLLP